MDVGAIFGGACALIAGVLAWTQSRRSNARADFTVIAERLDKKIAEQEKQQKLLLRAYYDLRTWAWRVGPDTTAGPPPDPPEELTVTPWLN